MTFDDAYAAFLAHHISCRRGEARRRLEEGLGYAEKLFLERVWWPTFGHFRHLHPEYEVPDAPESRRYIDFAFVTLQVRLAIEIEGYGPHLANVDRWQFADQCRRQNSLVIDGWALLRFSVDDIRDHPARCRRTIEQFMGRRLGSSMGEAEPAKLTPVEREIVRLARGAPAIRPSEVTRRVGLGRHAVYRCLHRMVEAGWLEPVASGRRIRAYRLSKAGLQLTL